MTIATTVQPTGEFAPVSVTARTKPAAIRRAKHDAHIEGFKVLDVASAVEQFENRWTVELKVEPR